MTLPGGDPIGGPLEPAVERAATIVLSRPPRAPVDVDLFSSNTLFGQPGIYPAGSPMVPATAQAGDAGSDGTRAAVRSQLQRVLSTLAGPASIEALLARYDGALAVAVPDDGVRAAVTLLGATIAAPVLAAFPDRTEVTTLRFGVSASAGRVVGPPADRADRSDVGHGRVVNDRYRYEHPALMAPSLAHDLLWDPGMQGHAAETLLHAVAAMVHLQLIAADPTIARAGTELARRQNSLAITLLHSRSPGSHRIALCAPDGPGTIPGGAPGMQTPDFWSVPFAPVGDDESTPLIDALLTSLTDGAGGDDRPAKLAEASGPWFSRHLEDRWLPVRSQVRASVALGLLDLADIATEAGASVGEMAVAFGFDGPPAA